MSLVSLVKFRFKPDKKQIWLDWSQELLRRKEEVIETLKNEGVVSESCFISQNGEEVYYFMEALDLNKAHEMVDKNPHPIDNEHKIARQSSLEFVEKLEVLFEFANRN